MRAIRLVLVVLPLMCTTALSTFAQDDEKAEITVTSFRNEEISLKYEYVFRQYSWAIMNYTLEPAGEVTYRRPANLLGCSQLKSWGIDQGRFSISAADQDVCTGPLSICDTTNYAIEVHKGGCKWKKRQ